MNMRSSNWSEWFENQVLNLIIQACSGREILRTKGNELTKFSADAYLPNGCKKLDIPKKTYIEVKFKLNTDTIWKWNTRIESTFGEEENLFNFLMVTHRPVFSDEMVSIGSGEYKVKVISFEALKLRLQDSLITNKDTHTTQGGASITPNNNTTSIDKTRDNYEKGGNNSESTKVQSQESINKKKKSQEELFEQLRKALNSEEKVTLFLGAGASIAAGLPSWEKILGNLLDEVGVRGGYKDLLNKANYYAIDYGSNHSPLILVRYVRCGAGLKPLIWGNVLQNLPVNDKTTQNSLTPWDDIRQNQLEFNRILHDAL